MRLTLLRCDILTKSFLAIIRGEKTRSSLYEPSMNNDSQLTKKEKTSAIGEREQGLITRFHR